MPGNPRSLQAAERRRQALELRRAGASYEDIGRALEVNKGTIHRWVMRAIHEATVEPARELITVEQQRLDRMQQGLWAKATQGNATAVLAVLKIMERRARLLGLDAPQRVDVGVGGVDLDGAVTALLELAAPDGGLTAIIEGELVEQGDWDGDPDG